ncbi:MAG: cysteine desulfurase, partial [Clostridia bacterium]|nr:cysteine desulfurase [Clostridia bacterium]
MIYLDHAATTPLDKCVLEDMTPYLTEIYGNAQSQHAFGRRAANAVIAARDEIAKIIGVPSDDIYFTSGGTEAGNTALKGVCAANADKGKHVILSAIEHPALLESARDLCKLGYELTLIYPATNGIIDPNDVKKAIRHDTVFVGVMAANNEVGTVQPVADIYEICKNAGVFYYCDCVQTAGVLDFKNFPADGIGFSAHKFYGPKGFGGLYMRGNYKFTRLISGGGQEKGLRGGTTYVAGAVGCATALRRAVADCDKNNLKVAALRDRFLQRVLSEIDGVHLNGDKAQRLPSNANLSFDGCDGENILFLLDLNGIAVSTGSACSAGAVSASNVLTAMGLSEERVKSAVRFTFGKYNTKDEADVAVQELKAAA